MGKILKTKFSNFIEVSILVLALVLVGGAVYYFAPGLRVSGSEKVEALKMNTEDINNTSKDAKLELPSTDKSSEVSNKPLRRIAEYAWNGNSAMVVANGGPRTTSGSLMEKAGLNLEIVRIDGVSALRDMLVNFTAEYDAGNKNPKGEKTAFAVSVMGDGGPYLISTTQETLNQKFGKNKYHVQNIGAIGLSYGEDKLIGPRIWKDNPQSMRGAVISSVIGDGDWVIAVNYAAANKIPVNTDVTTYDPDAINFVPSKDDEYINSAKELIASEKTGYTVPLKEVKDGKLTGKEVEKKITGCTTWTPGDMILFESVGGFTTIASTKDFVNQMATSIITIKEWAIENDKDVINMFKQTYVAANQIKQYDEWAVKASEAICKTYNYKTPQYWYELFKGKEVTANGETNTVGGSRVFNYADAMQYFGLSDGINRYKSVYDQVSFYLTKLNPGGFNQSCKSGVVPYDDAVNLYFLKSINDIDAGQAEKVDYTVEKTEVLATGEWNINFASGKADIQSTSTSDLKTIYNLLIQAENTKLKIVGHTDNTGNSGNNQTLSVSRANAVVDYLTKMGIPKTRFQLVDGKGDKEPIASNSTEDGKAKNRRVVITLLQ